MKDGLILNFTYLIMAFELFKTIYSCVFLCLYVNSMHKVWLILNLNTL
jgi:hypothetical protein